MIYLITAVPGSGKTLYTLKWLKEFADRENRQVYYSGIPLSDKGKEMLGWQELEDPETWHKLPPGAITVIDECQRIFPVRRAGGQVPEYVSAFETHRHKGHDVVLITQHPNLMDSHIRRLVGKHVHLLRIFGMQAAQKLSWDGIQENPNSASARQQCLDKTKFVYPKEVYTWYKSAELHTHKRQLPRRVWFFLFLLLVLGALIPFSLHLVKNMGKKPDAAPGVEGVPSNGMPGAQPKHVLTPAEYVQMRQPRVVGVPESAEIYDDLAKPSDFPHMSACLLNKVSGRCSCYDQQGIEIYGIDKRACQVYAEKGWFNPYLSRDRELADNRSRNVQRDRFGQQEVPARSVPASAPVAQSLGHVPHEYPSDFPAPQDTGPGHVLKNKQK